MSEQKKILFVRPTLGYGGADRVTLNLLKGFDRSAYLCDLALMRAEGEFIDDLPDDVKTIDLRARSLWFMVTPLLRLLKTTKYDVVYSTCGGASMPMMLAAWLSGYKGTTVVSERNILFPPKKNKSKRKLMLWIKKLLYKKASWVTAVSKGVADECVEILKTRPNTTVVVNNPIINNDLLTGKEEPVADPFFKKFDKVLLAVGRFEWQKDYDTLFEAFSILLKKNPGVGLYILGKGPLEQYYRDKAQVLAISDNIHFGGFDKNPFKYMSACDIYILSSRHEGMPGVLVQAMACGTACVATDCPTGPNELIKDGENGFLTQVEDAKSIADAINKLLKDDSLQTRFSDRAPKSVTRFAEQEGTQSYFSFLE
ncbi:MAG: glycosyltransferase [Roseivirga sp.]|nr:glycosyltransferase [Roseivirga sp.]